MAFRSDRRIVVGLFQPCVWFALLRGLSRELKYARQSHGWLFAKHVSVIRNKWLNQLFLLTERSGLAGRLSGLC